MTSFVVSLLYIFFLSATKLLHSKRFSCFSASCTKVCAFQGRLNVVFISEEMAFET